MSPVSTSITPRSLLAAEMSMDRIRARANGCEEVHPGHVFDNHVAGIDGAACHLREAISARDGMIYNFEFAQLLHFCPRNSVLPGE